MALQWIIKLSHLHSMVRDIPSPTGEVTRLRDKLLAEIKEGQSQLEGKEFTLEVANKLYDSLSAAFKELKTLVDYEELEFNKREAKRREEQGNDNFW